MPNILVCQHVPHELLGTLNPLLKSRGFRMKYVNFGRHPDARPSLAGYDGLVILGGPMNVDEVARFPFLAHEVALVHEARDGEQPVLGICLGAQLVAKALGGVVSKAREREIGWYELSLTAAAGRDPLLRHFGGVEQVFEWHGDVFSVPPGAEPLASTAGCANQAIRFGERIYGLQFHLEVDEPMIERWLRVPTNLVELAELKDRGITAESIRAITPRHIARLQELGRETFTAFAGLFGESRRLRLLPSR
ncbi:MAG: gamma-glutamyl-gamma-aminobutyrate hydrolase family protein [Deltaproteobacteria bacterium]|nr:gamma-glutamyl-gamma-aminobutyrate hydrolase family protein [Deltaproteobacteria bacterium]